MMDHMKEALQRKMLAMRGQHPQEAGLMGVEHDGAEQGDAEDAAEMQKEKEKNTDLAPKLDQEKHAGEQVLGKNAAGEDGADPGGMHEHVIAALASGHGSPGSLHERVSNNAKEKMASIEKNKHKHGKF
jgi:hypothetical protein